MATERNAKPLSEFFKFNELGDMVCGKVAEVRSSANGPFLVIERALLRRGRKGQIEAYASVAVNVASDMRGKVDLRGDAGKLMMFIYNDTEPTKHDSDKKIFRVLEITGEDFRKVLADADTSHMNDPYKREMPQTVGHDDLGGNEDGDDELPF
jgi:hypothetical protein